MACVEIDSGCITQGDDWYYDWTATEDGLFDEETGNPTAPKNLTGATITLSFKDTIDGAIVVTPTIAITDAENGRVRFSLTDTQTESLITSGQGSRVLTGQVLVTFQDGTKETFYTLALTIHESWN